MTTRMDGSDQVKLDEYPSQTHPLVQELCGQEGRMALPSDPLRPKTARTLLIHVNSKKVASN
jgi:hypothetical protein